LIPDHPRFPLATFPTPLHRVERFELTLREQGCSTVPRIYFKRDDLLSLALGGNKIRNLEFLIGQALAEGATDVITEGRQQSNHCRLTAAACAKAGLQSHVVLAGLEPSRYTGNLVLDRLLGARIHFTGTDDRAAREAMVSDVERNVRDSGGNPFTIPVGGSDARGALGHVLLAAEIIQQMEALAERPVAVVLATATGGTQAGLIVGLRRLGRPTPVSGFAVAKSAPELEGIVASLATTVAGEIGMTVSSGDFVVDGSMLGPGYGVPIEAGQHAIETLARSEGILADPVYTGKGLAGLASMIRDRTFADDDAVVFIHTGGAPALLA
jgi:D-cysteine desulfhydrase